MMIPHEFWIVYYRCFPGQLAKKILKAAKSCGDHETIAALEKPSIDWDVVAESMVKFHAKDV